MKINGFIWLNQIVEKIEQKHNVQQYEVREIFISHPYFRFVERGHRSGEDVYATMGQTNAGRYLIVFFVYTKKRYAFILSARDMTQTERRKYEKR